MRELHAWHGNRRHAADANAEISSTLRAHDLSKHDVLRDPADRVAKHLEYRKIVEAAQANDGQTKPKAGPEHASEEARDRSGRIADRWEPLEDQGQKKRKPERSRLPSNETAQLMAGVSITVSSVADAVSVLPGRWDAVATSVVGAMVAGIAWGNKRWKDKHGNRPEH